MSSRRTNTKRFPTAVASPYAHPFLPTNKHGPQRGTTRSHPAQLGAQSADGRVEKILSQIQAEYMKLLDMHHEMLDRLRREKYEKAELQRQMDYQSDCLQAAEQRAWHFEERVNKLEVQLASREADQGRQD